MNDSGGELLHGELRTRLFPPMRLDVQASDIGALLGDVLQQQLGAATGAEPTQPAETRPLVFPRLTAWLLQPRVIVQSPIFTLDQAPEGDPGQQWKLWAPLLLVLVVAGVVGFLKALLD